MINLITKPNIKNWTTLFIVATVLLCGTEYYFSSNILENYESIENWNFKDNTDIIEIQFQFNILDVKQREIGRLNYQYQMLLGPVTTIIHEFYFTTKNVSLTANPQPVFDSLQFGFGDVVVHNNSGNEVTNQNNKYITIQPNNYTRIAYPIDVGGNFYTKDYQNVFQQLSTVRYKLNSEDQYKQLFVWEYYPNNRISYQSYVNYDEDQPVLKNIIEIDYNLNFTKLWIHPKAVSTIIIFMIFSWFYTYIITSRSEMLNQNRTYIQNCISKLKLKHNRPYTSTNEKKIKLKDWLIDYDNLAYKNQNLNRIAYLISGVNGISLFLFINLFGGLLSFAVYRIITTFLVGLILLKIKFERDIKLKKFDLQREFYEALISGEDQFGEEILKEFKRIFNLINDLYDFDNKKVTLIIILPTFMITLFFGGISGNYYIPLI